MTKPEMAMIGMGVMGRMLAQNFAEKGYDIAIFNRTDSKTQKVYDTVQDKTYSSKLHPVIGELKDLVKLVGKKGTYFVIVKAGYATNKTVEVLLELLEPGAVIVDLANSNFHDTIELEKKVSAKKIYFFGVGVSGGETGARYGPAIMPGGNKKTYDKILKEILEKIAAKAPQDNLPCVTYCGKNGAGHFVKMVHNGIEYADMQLIAESYDIMKTALNMGAEEISKVFKKWNKGILKSYLIEITSEVLAHKNPNDKNYLIDLILDKARMKGTGTWTIMSSLELEKGVVAIPTIYAAVEARAISNKKQKRMLMSKQLSFARPEFKGNKQDLINDLEKAMYICKISAYSQGFDLIKSASEEYDFGNIYISKIAKIWRAGCIIRADFLDDISKAYENKKLESLLIAPLFLKPIKNKFSSLDKICQIGIEANLPLIAFDTSRSYILQNFSRRLPANLIQGLRDYFGSHTYERNDKKGTYHTNWASDKKEVKK